MLKRLDRILLIIVGVLLIAYVIARLIAKPAPSHPWFTPRPGENKPLVFAHQGAENLWPSNTMFAFQHAAHMGVDVLDTDMHMTQDGVLVLMHDETVDRTTDGTGAIRDLRRTSSSSSTRATVSVRMTGRRSPIADRASPCRRWKSCSRPFLTSVSASRSSRRTRSPPHSASAADSPLQHAGPGTGEQLPTGEHGRVSEGVPGSGDLPRPRTRCGCSACSSGSRLSDTLTPNYNSFQVPEASGGIHLLTPGLFAAAHRRGLPVQPWTINETEDLKRILALGVDGINTDNPDRLFALIK